MGYTTSVSNYGICYQLPLNIYPFERNRKQTIKFAIPIELSAQTELNIEYSKIQIDFNGENMTGLEPNIDTIKNGIIMKNCSSVIFKNVSISSKHQKTSVSAWALSGSRE